MPSRQFLSGLFDRAVPEALRVDVDRRRRAHLAVGSAAFIVVFGVLLSPVFLVLSTPEFRWVGAMNTLACCVLAGLAIVFVRRGSLTLAGHWICGLLFAGFAYATLVGGGMGAAFNVGYVILPVIATAIGGRAPGLVWGAIAAAFVAAVTTAQALGVRFPDVSPPETVFLLHAIALVSVLAVLTWVIGFSETLKTAAIHEVQRASKERDEAIREEQRARVAAEQAIAANAAKTSFLATMSHELRTPLNAIIGYAELIDEEAGPTLGEHAESLHRIVGAGHHLLTLISDILDISRIEAERLEFVPERFEVAALLDELSRTFGALAAGNGDRLAVEADPETGWVLLDRGRVRQILVNLVGNAIKFTQGGTITLRSRRIALADERACVEIDVVDTGVGIAADKQALIFEPFTQADQSSARLYEGSGLGLAIVAKLCRLMGGQVKVRSALGQGSTFTVRLPTPPG
ncbi:MAG: ATP-binding protein [Nannocystaceae bacterium]